MKQYEKLTSEKHPEDSIYCVVGTHPLHNSQPSCGWILRGNEKQIPSNTGRKRGNLNGALTAETHKVVVRQDSSINARSTISLFKQLERLHPKAEKIYVILDNARY